jgi:hypothetical protein
VREKLPATDRESEQVRRSGQVPLNLLAAAVVSLPSAGAHAELPVQPAVNAAERGSTAAATAIERGGFGFHLDELPFLVVVGAWTIFLLARSGGE